MKVGINVVMIGMNSEIAKHRGDEAPTSEVHLRDRQPAAHAQQPLQAHGSSRKDHRVEEASQLDDLGHPGESVRVIGEMQRARDHLGRLDGQLCVGHQ